MNNGINQFLITKKIRLRSANNIKSLENDCIMRLRFDDENLLAILFPEDTGMPHDIDHRNSAGIGFR